MLWGAMVEREPIIYRLFPRSPMRGHSDLILRDCDDEPAYATLS
jgi:hypothetical protein